MTIFADAGAAGPWWVPAIVTPLTTSLITLVGAWLLLTRTEFGRRVSRWESYADKLWACRAEAYGRLLELCYEAMFAADRFDREQEPERGREFSRRLLELQGYRARITTIIGNELAARVGEFSDRLARLTLNEPPDDPTDSIVDLYNKILTAARHDLHIKPLDQKSELSLKEWSKGLDRIRKETR